MADSTSSPNPVGFRAWLARQPWWVVLLVGAGVFLAGGIAKHYGLPDPSAIVNLTVQNPPAGNIPTVAQGASPTAEMVIGQGPARRLLANLIRHRVSKELQKNGFKLIGGNPRPLSAAEAEKLLDRLDDEQLIEGAKAAGGLGDGKILDALGRLVDWIVAHQDQILAILKWVLTLLALFGDDPQAAAPFPAPVDAVAWHELTSADAGLWLLAT